MASKLDLAGRKALTALLAIIFPPRHEVEYSWTENPPARVLLVRHDDRIGNLVLMKPLLEGIRQIWPDAETGVLIGPRFAQIYQEEPEIDRLWISADGADSGTPSIRIRHRYRLQSYALVQLDRGNAHKTERSTCQGCLRTGEGR